MKLISPTIPAELRTPVPVPDRQAKTLRDVGLLVVDYDEALAKANSKIVAVDNILIRFETRIGAAQ